MVESWLRVGRHLALADQCLLLEEGQNSDETAWVLGVVSVVGARAGVLEHARIEHQSCVVWRGVAWHGVTWCGVAWRGVVWRGVMKCGVVWCGVVWCGAV